MADLRRFVITRDIPGIDASSDEDLKQASKTSNAALEQLNGGVEWESSFIVADKTYCIYKAKDEAAIKKHAEISGFPATHIEEIKGTISPATAN